MHKGFAFDLWLVGPSVILLIFSSTLLRSIQPQEIVHHLLYVTIAIFVFLVVAGIDYRVYAPLAKGIYAIGLILLMATFIFGRVTRGTIRWIELGILTIQPSELIKPIMILALSTFINHRNLHRGIDLVRYTAMLATPTWLVFKQPDLGSALVLVTVGITIAFAAGISLRTLVAAIGGMILVLPLILNILHPYQKERLRAFIDPYADPLGSGYNVIQSVIAIGSGEIFGRGLGHGTQSQLRFLPESHSDFIFASMVEELGFVGGILVLICYLTLLVRLLTIAKEAADPLGSFISVGVFGMIFFQLVVNVGMNLGLMPVTGITLPLISSGGSSLLATMASLGIAQSVARRVKPQKTIEIH